MLSRDTGNKKMIKQKNNIQKVETTLIVTIITYKKIASITVIVSNSTKNRTRRANNLYRILKKKKISKIISMTISPSNRPITINKNVLVKIIHRKIIIKMMMKESDRLMKIGH